MIWAVAQLKTETTKICKKSSKSCSEHDSTLRKIFFRFGRRRIRESARTSLFKNVEPKKYHNTWRSQWICIFYYHTFVWRWRTAGRQRPAGLAFSFSPILSFWGIICSFVSSHLDKFIISSNLLSLFWRENWSNFGQWYDVSGDEALW